jgi:hypothetical protein
MWWPSRWCVSLCLLRNRGRDVVTIAKRGGLRTHESDRAETDEGVEWKRRARGQGSEHLDRALCVAMMSGKLSHRPLPSPS